MSGVETTNCLCVCLSKKGMEESERHFGNKSNYYYFRFDCNLSARPTNIHPFDETASASDSALTDSIHSHRQQQHQLTHSDLGGLRFVSFSNPSTLDLITTETKANRQGSVRFNSARFGSVRFGFSCCMW